MNGQFMPVQAVARPNWAGPGLDERAAVPLRLLFALALSCLLHAAVVFLPYLGKSTREGRFAPTAHRDLPPALDAKLVPAGAPAQRTAVSAAAGAPTRADPSAAIPVRAPAGPVSPQTTDGADLLPLAAPVYYTTDQLSKRPQPLAVAELDAPQTRPIIASGKIVLTLWINEFGVVADVAVEKSDLPEIFGRSAAEAFKALRFEPGERDGRPVATVMHIEVNYDDSRLKPD